MSELNVNAITDSSGGNTASINGATPTNDNLMGRNRIINGDMRIDQRNAGASTTPSTSSTYNLDRWQVVINAASKFSVQQNAGAVTPPAGFTNYLGVTSLSAYSVGASEVFGIRQNIEGLNLSDFGWGTADAQTVTLSFWVRSSLTGTFGGSFKNSAGNRAYPFSYTISAADTWEKKSVVIAGDTTGTWLTTNGIGIRLAFSLGAGASVSGTDGAWVAGGPFSTTGATSVVGTNGATFYITGVQLEAGSVATSFERRSYGQELALCQRYANVMRVLSGGFNCFGITGFFENTTNGVAAFQFPVQMRASPTFTFSAANTFLVQTTSNLTPSAVSAFDATNFSTGLAFTVSGASAGAGLHIIRNNSVGSETTITASAEL